MKLAVVVLCTLCFAYVRSQGLAEMMMMTSLLGRQGGSGSGSSSTGSNSLASLMGSSASSTNPFAALASSSSGGAGNPLAALSAAGASGTANPLSALTGGGGLGRMAGGMMLGGAEMSNLMDFWSCGAMRLPMNMCFMMMQQNM